MVTWTADRAFLRLVDGRCAQLVAGPPVEGQNRVQCGIYAERPSPCREFERGSAECLGELADKAARAEAFRAEGG